MERAIALEAKAPIYNERLPLQTVVLCGGKGSRISELTQETIPKHLIDLGDEAILDHALRPFTKTSGLIMATGFHGDQIREYLDNSPAYDIPISYSHQEYPQGVNSAIAQAVEEHSIESTFILAHGDEIVSGLDLHSMYEFHHARQSEATIAITKLKPVPHDYAMWVDSDYKVSFFKRGELSEDETLGSYYAIGTFMLEPSAAKELSGFENWEAFLKHLTEQGALNGFPCEASFYNLNSPKELEEFTRYLGGLALAAVQ